MPEPLSMYCSSPVSPSPGATADAGHREAGDGTDGSSLREPLRHAGVESSVSAEDPWLPQAPPTVDSPAAPTHPATRRPAAAAVAAAAATAAAAAAAAAHVSAPEEYHPVTRPAGGSSSSSTGAPGGGRGDAASSCTMGVEGEEVPEFAAWPMKELKLYLASRNCSMLGVNEKVDLVRLCRIAHSRRLPIGMREEWQLVQNN